MIDPITALAGIQSAISMVKKAAKIANDLGSLAPMIGKMFDAKSTATKALMEAKKSKKGSNMGTALQIEMALEQARAFEEELNEWGMIIGAVAFIVFIFGIGTYELMEWCQTSARCGR